MNYLSSNQVKKYIPLNFSLVDLFCLFDLLNFQKTRVSWPSKRATLKDLEINPRLICQSNQVFFQLLGSRTQIFAMAAMYANHSAS